jgi:hypothetical protein
MSTHWDRLYQRGAISARERDAGNVRYNEALKHREELAMKKAKEVIKRVNDRRARFVQCIHCGRFITWLEHTHLLCAMDCPDCGAKKQFGPGIYVDSFKGYPLDYVVQLREERKHRVTKGE